MHRACRGRDVCGVLLQFVCVHRTQNMQRQGCLWRVTAVCVCSQNTEHAKAGMFDVECYCSLCVFTKDRTCKSRDVWCGVLLQFVCIHGTLLFVLTEVFGVECWLQSRQRQGCLMWSVNCFYLSALTEYGACRGRDVWCRMCVTSDPLSASHSHCATHGSRYEHDRSIC